MGEITQAMIAAGVRTLLNDTGRLTREQIVIAIYQAMQAARSEGLENEMGAV